MTCETCNAATKCIEADEPQDEGRFKEEYECANGHKGWIRGFEQAPPKEWKKTGAVFEA